MKLIVLLIVLLLLTSGCGIYNLNYFVIPDDMEFTTVVVSLDTPEKICDYMKENFTAIECNKYVFSPYEMWIFQEGDCNDYSNFAIFCADYNGIEVYQIYWNFGEVAHMMGIYKISDGYKVTDWDYCHEKTYKTFREIADMFSVWEYYIIYDYEMEIIEQGVN